jgi:translation initiation factor 3 subunit B
MAPSFDHLPDPEEEEEYDEEEELDFSGMHGGFGRKFHSADGVCTDLRERFEVQLEQGLDGFVVIDGLPEVTEETKPKLVKFLLRKLNSVGKAKEESVFMPMGDDGKSLKYVLANHIPKILD